MKVTDERLVNEVRKRLDQKNTALADLKELTKSLEQVNKKLQESERLKSSFISNLKNEINNPLTSLVALSGELVTLDLKDEKKYRTIAGMINYEARNLDFQIRNVLMVSEIESGENPLHITRVEACSLIGECIENFGHLLDDKAIRVDSEEQAPLWINTDTDKLAIILSNLISNGIVFNKEGGKLKISVDVGAGCFRFVVKDEGIGIRAEDQETIFDWFKQLDTGLTKRYRGHGLGLSVAKAAADLLGGSISVESEPGNGSTFTLRMPLQDNQKVNEVYLDGVDFFFEEGQEF